VTYAELEARFNRLAHFLRASGLHRLDHCAIFLENNVRYVETCAAGERLGLYYTCGNFYLTPDELAYILNNSESKLLITSQAKRDVALAALRQCPDVAACLTVDGPGDGAGIMNLDQATAGYPETPTTDECLGSAMLYSSGTTGRPKSILRPMPMQPPVQALPIYDFLLKLWRFRPGLIYLSPAPLYHAAPHVGINLTIRMGGTAIIMEHFDAEHFLRLSVAYFVD
jgi:long-chain acyl-CoA synthetase